MLKQYKLRFYNFRLIIFLLAISLIGVTLVGTAASDLRSKQFAGVILGLIVMLVLSLLDYSWIMNFQWIMYGFNIIMLIVVRIAGDSANGAARWIGIGSFRFQPTELSKIILIVFFAKFFMDHEETLNTLKTLALSGVLLAVPLFLILEQPDLKNTITVVVIFCIMIYVAGLSYKKVEELGVISPVVEISVAYRKQVFFDDEIRIRVGIKQYNGISLEFNYEFFNASRNEICTTAYSRHCFLKDGKLIALKKELPELNRIITDCL